ncbi:unnamed protein product [Adineta ricciae]|uniref:ABM domain-containing protein n=2 Tax=Adineta ricciae TaxID=249248 RepID=A0A814XFI1_ADIRI|nr:unnamed protein product [Adineta ricciae]
MLMTDARKSVVYVVADLWPFPEKAKEAKQILIAVVPEAKKERSCLKYELCENYNDQAQLTLLQAWSTEEALEAHLNGELITKASENLRTLLALPTVIRRYKNIG